MTEPIFEQTKVQLESLMLDPNNPRFVQSLDVQTHTSDQDIPGEQDRVRKKFRTDRGGEEDEGEHEEFFGIKDLVDSMSNIGFIPIDRVVVRKLDGLDQYLVVEGNRRVAAAKYLQERQEELPPRKKLSADAYDSLLELPVLVLKAEGASHEEIDRQVGVILGLRHYGSVKEWDPLPKAVNIYKQYMGGLNSFRHDNKRFRETATALSISPADAKSACRTYIAYVQLREAFEGVEAKHYSLIEGVVKNNKLRAHRYVDAAEDSYQLTEASLDRINKVCQFETRERLVAEKKILQDPKAVAPFSRLVDDAHAGEEAVSMQARSLLAEVEEGERSLQDAVDALTAFKASRRWVEALEKLLDKQEEELQIEDYSGAGNDLIYKEELDRSFGNFRKLMGIG